MRRYRSPDCAPPVPCSPSPLTRTRDPSVTPAGMRHRNRARVAVGLDRQLARRALRGLLQRQRDLRLDVAAVAARPRLGGAAAPAGVLRIHAPPKNVWKKSENGSSSPNMSRISSAVMVRNPPPGRRPRSARSSRQVRRAGPPGAARLLVHPPVGPELVVLPALVGIAEHLVGLVDLLELRLGRLVARIDVRVVLARKLPERLLDFLFRRRFRDAERGVVVLEFHGYSSPSIFVSSSISCDSRRASRGGDRLVTHQRPDPLHDCRNRQQPLDARQVDSGIVDQALDGSQPFESHPANTHACCRSCGSAESGPAGRTSGAFADASRASAPPR